MYSKIVQLNRLGVRRPEVDVANDPGVYGHVTQTRVGGHKVLSVTRHGDTTSENKLLPPLFHPECEGWGGNRMVWRGYQRPRMRNKDEPAPVFMQEWRVELIGERPPPEHLDRF